MSAGQQSLDHRPDSLRTQHQGLLASSAVEHAVREDMTALEIGAKLHLINGHEGNVEVARHGLDRGDPIAWARRLYLLLARDEGARIYSPQGRDPFVDPAA